MLKTLIAILFTLGANYERKDLSSPLHKSNTINFVNGSNEKEIEEDLISLNPNSIDYLTQINIILKGFILFIKNIKYCKNKTHMKGILISSLVFVRYKLWINYFSKYDVKNIIYDYDINFSKALSLALETLEVNTIAICERPSLLMLNGFGVIVNNYLIPGNLYNNYAQENDSYIFDNSYIINFWRIKYFDEFKNRKISKSDYIAASSESKTLKSFKGKIVIIGLSFKTASANCFINKRANEEFLNIVGYVANYYKEFAVILRMKDLNSSDENTILNKFKSLNNFFLCNNYRKEGLSYLLCKEADLIISLPTSLAEECIAYGKKVIFLNNLYTINRISSDIYPKEYKFAIAKDNEELIGISNKIIECEKSLSANYKALQKNLNVTEVFEKQKNLPDLLESLLK